MENKILGLHHVTAIAGAAQRNYGFYTKVLGLRLVKKTVNFDDPGTYHFYFGDEVGTPGTILTFFPWEGIRPGIAGAGMATQIRFSVPAGSFDFWADRFKTYGVKTGGVAEYFGEKYLQFQDPDGLLLSLVVPLQEDHRVPWQTNEVTAKEGIKGFHSVELTLRNEKATARVLTDIFGYTLEGQEGNRYRYATSAIATAHIIDIVEAPQAAGGINAGGTNHHIAFRVKDEETLMTFRQKVAHFGLSITEKIDRNYFYSLYFREPGGVLFEIATDNPGFAVDEPVAELGTNLKLPPQYENSRQRIEAVLPVLQ